MGPQLTVAVVAKNAGEMCAFLAAHSGMAAVRPVVNTTGESLASIGNRYLDAARTPVFGLIHADVQLGAGAAEVFTAVALEGFVTGIVGIDLDRHYRWCHTKQRRSKPDGSIEDVPGPVSTLDSCSVFFPRGAGLRFDERIFDSFHCHVEDLCLQAQARGIGVVVPRADADHAALSTFDPGWQETYRVYRGRLGQKWAGVEFQTT